ncbi:hypothetical protein FBU31_001821 [Coemansia sp. 'formosensis']|nr:hypothetical protein FBU31_001821 [Coemansia sp. 'formosensis']
MSQQYAPVDLANVVEASEVDMEASVDQAVSADSHDEPSSNTTVTPTLAYIATNHQQKVGDTDEDEEEEEEGEAEFDPLFEFTDDIQEKPANHRIQVRDPSSRVWQVISSANWSKVLRFTATYLALPFITGVMAGMGEIFANEFMYRWGWRGARPVAVAGRSGRVFPVREKASSIASHELID